MKRSRIVLGLVCALAFVSCEDCSERQQLDLRTEADLDHVLIDQYATSWDAGVAQLAALESQLAPVLELTPARLAELADASVADVENDGGYTTVVRVSDRTAARALVGQLLDRQVPVFFVTELDGGVVEFEVDVNDPARLAPDVFPAWLPAASDGIPCFSCAARAQRITDKRALLTEFSTKLDRLRRLRHVKKEVDRFASHAPSAGLRTAVLRALDARLQPGTRLLFYSDVRPPPALIICGSGMSVEQCAATFDGGKCVTAEFCFGRPCSDAASCGVSVFP